MTAVHSRALVLDLHIILMRGTSNNTIILPLQRQPYLEQKQ